MDKQRGWRRLAKFQHFYDKIVNYVEFNKLTSLKTHQSD